MSRSWRIWETATALILVATLAAVPVIGALRGELDYPNAIRFLEVLTSWQLIAGAVGVLLLVRHRAAIDLFLQNVRKMQLPGGVALETQPTAPPPQATPAEAAETVSATGRDDLRALVKLIDESKKISDKEKQWFENLYNKTLLESINWRWQFFNTFLVPATKQVLHWFATTGPSTRAAFHAVWQSFIPNAVQREVMLSVLIQYKLLEQNGDLLKASSEGVLFLRWVGMIAPS